MDYYRFAIENSQIIEKTQMKHTHTYIQLVAVPVDDEDTNDCRCSLIYVVVEYKTWRENSSGK